MNYEGKSFSGAYLMAKRAGDSYNHKVDYHKQNDYSSRVLYLEEGRDISKGEVRPCKGELSGVKVRFDGILVEQWVQRLFYLTRMYIIMYAL